MRKLFIILIPFLCILFCLASCNELVNDVLDSSEIISAEFTDSNYDKITVHYSRVPSNPSVKILVYNSDGSRNAGHDSSQTQVMKKNTVTLTNAVPSGGRAVIGAADNNDTLFGSITLSRP